MVKAGMFAVVVQSLRTPRFVNGTRQIANGSVGPLGVPLCHWGAIV